MREDFFFPGEARRSPDVPPYCKILVRTLTVSPCLYRFTLMEQYLIEFNQLAMAHAEGSEAMLNRVMIRDNIGIAALLELKDQNLRLPPQHLLVANAHIHWDPEYCDVKLIQTIMFMQELDTIVMRAQAERGIGVKTPVPGWCGGS